MTAPDTTTRSTKPALPGWFVTAARLLITAGLPLVLVLLNARALMSNTFLRLEYNRAGFPEDSYGLTTAQRLEYAPRALAYLFNNQGVDYLAEQSFPDGSPLYNARELSHMQDVKEVTQMLTRIGVGLLAAVGISAFLLGVEPSTRLDLYRALFGGGVLTVLLIVSGLIAVATSFNWLFTQFHRIFFEGDTWIFRFSDTLIRLFPERFWIDAFALMFGGALVEGLVIAGLAWRRLRAD